MNFGVSGTNIGWNNLAIHRNPVTMAAIQRQQERERQARILAEMTAQQRREIEAARVAHEKRMMEQDRKERRFRSEFLHMIYAQRSFHEANVALIAATDTPPKPHMRDIIRDFAVRNSTTYADLIGPDTTRDLVRIRHAAMYEVHIKRPDRSYSEVGREFGGRDHTSIMSGIGSHALRNDIDHPLREFALRKKKRCTLYHARERLEVINESIVALKKKAAKVEQKCRQLAA